jgi:UDP-glucose 4-epimerase
VFDFYRALRANPAELKILGDGQQRKSYLYVQDCIDAMLHVTRAHAAREAKHHTEIYNLGTPEYVEVNQSIGYLCAALGLRPRLEYTGGDRGWIGDNPFIFLDTAKIQATGWQATHTIEQGILKTLRWLEANRWVYESRK